MEWSCRVVAAKHSTLSSPGSYERNIRLPSRPFCSFCLFNWTVTQKYIFCLPLSRYSTNSSLIRNVSYCLLNFSISQKSNNVARFYLLFAESGWTSKYGRIPGGLKAWPLDSAGTVLRDTSVTTWPHLRWNDTRPRRRWNTLPASLHRKKNLSPWTIHTADNCRWKIVVNAAAVLCRALCLVVKCSVD